MHLMPADVRQNGACSSIGCACDPQLFLVRTIDFDTFGVITSAFTSIWTGNVLIMADITGAAMLIWQWEQLLLLANSGWL